MKRMSKLGRKMKSVKVAMMMALLFCVFLCPHSADAFIDECAVFAPGIACQDLCECHDHGHHHTCEIDVSHSHEFLDDTSLALSLDFNQIGWVRIAPPLEEPQPPIHYFDVLVRSSIHTYAVRHLGTIILRV